MVVAQKTNTARPRKPYTYPEETAVQLQRELRNTPKSAVYEPMETAAQLRTEQQRTTTAAEKAMYQKESELRQAAAAVKQSERQLAQYTADPYVQNFEKAYAVNNTAQQRVQQTEHPWDLRDSVARERQVIRSEKRLANHVVQKMAARNTAASDRAWQRYDTTGHARDLGHAMAMERQTVSPYQPVRNINRWNGELERSQNQYAAAMQRQQEAERDYAAAVQQVRNQQRKDPWMDRMEREIAYHMGADGLELMLQYSAAEQINREIKQLYTAPGTGPVAEYGPAAQLRQQLLSMGATPAQLDRWQEYGVMVNNAKNAKAVNSMWKSAADRNGMGYSVWSAAVKPYAALAANIDQQGQRFWNRLTGSDKPIDRNTAAMQVLQMDQTIEKQTIANIQQYCENAGYPELAGIAVQAYLAAKDGVSELATVLPGKGLTGLQSVLNSSRYAADRMMDSYAAGNSDNKALNDALLTFGLNVAPQNLVNQKIQSQWAQQGLSGVVKGALSRGATKAALATTAMGIDTWLNDEESDFAVAKKGYLALGYTEEQAENQVKADCVRYILGEGLSGAAEGVVAAGLEVGRYKKTAEEVGKTVKESGEAAELMDKLNRLPEDTEAKRLLTKARDAFMEKAEKKLNRLKDAYEEENHGDLTTGKIERIGQLSKDIKDYEAYVKEVLDGWEFVDEKRLGEIVLALDESEVWRLPKNSRKLYQEMQAETVRQTESLGQTPVQQEQLQEQVEMEMPARVDPEKVQTAKAEPGGTLTKAPETDIVNKKETVTYRRVQGGDSETNRSAERIFLNEDGTIRIPNKKSYLYISTEETKHGEYFQDKRGGDAYIIEFEVPKWWDDMMREYAIPQKNYRSNPLNQNRQAPQIGDWDATYGLPAPWIAWLEEYAIDGRIIHQ